MTLKVWRGRTFFAECTDCGSYGSAPALQTKTKLEPEIEAALEQHTARMMALRSHFTTAANKIASQIRDGSITREDGVARIKPLYENHVAQIRLAEAGLPDPAGKVTQLATQCPWCGKAEDVEIQMLAENQTEPEFEQAKAVTAYIAAEQAKAAKANSKKGA